MIGTRVLSIYTITKALGEGGMGSVWLATSNTGHKIVIKLLHPQYTRHPSVMERFHREAGIAAQIKHPNVIEMMGSGTLDDGQTFLAMEWLDGKSLADHLHSWGKLTAADALPILVQLAAGMQAAHGQGIVHRDMKPDNVYVCNEPRGEIKILDFGISKRVSADANAAPLTGVDSAMGTPWYMAPEQAKSARDVTMASDIFAVGVIAFEMLAGFRPYRSDKPDETGLGTYLTLCAHVELGLVPRPSLAAALGPRRDDIPPIWIQTIERAIDVRQGARQQTIREFIEPLIRSVSGGEALARQLAPDLFTAASPADETYRAVRGDATRPGTPASTAPHAAIGPTTFQGASGQVAASAPRAGRTVPVIVGAVVVVGVAIAIAIAIVGTRSPANSPVAQSRGIDAAIDAGASTVDAAQMPVPPVDAAPTPDAVAAPDARKRPHRSHGSPDDID